MLLTPSKISRILNALVPAIVLWTQSANAQPLITSKGIVNAAATLTPPGLPSGSIARGSLFTVLGPAAGVSASSYPLLPTLSDVSIKITQGSVSVDAIPVFVRADQINAIMPSNAPLGLASIAVTYNNIPGPPNPVQIVVCR